MASNIAVIYAKSSKVIRQTIVPGPGEDLDSKIKPIPGEGVLVLPLDALKNLRAIVASMIGEPGPDRCVELDKDGIVVAIHQADPLLDKPTLHPDNVLKLHATADIGDVKQGGEIVSMKPVPVQPTKDEMTVILKYKDGAPPDQKTWTADEATTLAKFGIEVTPTKEKL